jgi:hypothetical protein
MGDYVIRAPSKQPSNDPAAAIPLPEKIAEMSILR